jgi:ribonucleoside-diphosphate reductase alpha chain
LTFKSTINPTFRSALAERIFNEKYRHEGAETWLELCKTLVEDVCKKFIPDEAKKLLTEFIYEQKFIPGGRYLYYAGRKSKFFNNCYLLKSLEDTREDWAELSKKAELCLTRGGGIGNDYSTYRPRGSLIHRTGGVASGPLSKMEMINEIGRHVIQGGTRRSAIYASLSWKHQDIQEFLRVKDWSQYPVGNTGQTLADIKKEDFNFRAPLDMTNISINYDTEWLLDYYKFGVNGTFLDNVTAACRHGEPGFSFNFFEKESETLRNACTEVTSSDDSDVCNLGSVNLSRIRDLTELSAVVELATMFLLCGTLVADLPYDKVKEVRAKNRRLGLGLMGVHEWLIQRGYSYEVTPELHQWLTIYKGASDYASAFYASKLGVSRPIANRAVAPTGTIGMLAGTTTGIEPIYAVAYKRRYLTGGHKWKYQFAIDTIAKEMIDLYDVNPDDIETSSDLAADPERRIKFQADVQQYVDMGISSTINLPSWGSESNNPDTVRTIADLIAKYSSRLRGFTCYPDGSRGGQPLVRVPYVDAVDKLGEEYDEYEYNDVCSITGRGGFCGT